MLKPMIEAYRTSGRFMRVLPLLVAIPVAAELVQHVVEWRTGMFDSYAMAEAVAEHPARMGFGHVKVAALFLMGYWAMRFLAFEGDGRRTRRWDPVAAALFSLVLVFQALAAVVQDQAGSWISATVPAGAPLLLTGFAAMLAAMAPRPCPPGRRCSSPASPPCSQRWPPSSIWRPGRPVPRSASRIFMSARRSG